MAKEQPRKGFFAARLRLALDKAGMSQAEIGRRTGLSKQTISDLLLDKWPPSWETVQKLARALGVTCEAFADDPEPAVRQPPATKKKAAGRRRPGPQ
jgi:transcriptional regulator with XRE-family HTH domain